MVGALDRWRMDNRSPALTKKPPEGGLSRALFGVGFLHLR
jgi:hypothetical protein